MGRKREKEWTAAGAARSVREARIATVEYLQDAPIARPWHMSKLVTAYQYQVAKIGHEPTAQALLFTGMGYRSPYPSDWRAAAELVLTDEARYLAEAELYVLSPQMCDVVLAATQTLTRDDMQLLSEDDLPSPTGIVVLPHPVVIRAVTGELSDDRAFMWRTPAIIPSPTDGQYTLKDTPAVRISAYHDSYGPVRPESFLEFQAVAAAQGTPLPPWLLDAIRCVPFEFVPTTEQAEALNEYVNLVRTTSEREVDQVIGEYTPGSEIDDVDDSFTTRFLYAFWRLCAQRIATVDTAEVRHSARVLADRAGVSPDVRVVQVRQYAQQDDTEPAASGGRDWHHRWVVRMHKVRQWHPSEQRHKVIYRGPYIKGPADKPLLGGETIRGVTR